MSLSGRFFGSRKRGDSARIQSGSRRLEPLSDSKRVEPSSAKRESSHKIRANKMSKRIGQLLLKSNSINDAALTRALRTQRQEGGLLGQILVAQNATTNIAVMSALQKQIIITTVDITRVKIYPVVTSMVSRDFCIQYRLLPFERVGNFLCVAMANALDSKAKTELKQLTGFENLKIFDAEWSLLRQAISDHFDRHDHDHASIQIEIHGESRSTESSVKMPAIPLSHEYFTSVVQDGYVDSEKRWLIERTGTVVLGCIHEPKV